MSYASFFNIFSPQKHQRSVNVISFVSFLYYFQIQEKAATKQKRNKSKTKFSNQTLEQESSTWTDISTTEAPRFS
eukprot:m.13005 g.13005  ORF g.13005 m.13005 type:complete len:75 (+) comp4093_c0_seq1:132-356(+)